MRPTPVFKFRFYVAGDTQNSRQATANLLALCNAHLDKRHTIETVDVLRDPRRALEDGILITPTLLRLAPAPERKIFGTLARTRPVLMALGLEAFP